MSTHNEHHLGDDLEAMADGGGSLPEARRVELTEHVGTCAACQRALQDTRAALTMLKTPGLQPSTGFDAALFAKLDALDESQARPLWARIQQLFTLPRLYALGAVAAVLLIVVVTAERQAPTQSSAMDPIAQAELLDLAQDQQLYESLELLRNLDVLEDLEFIEALEAEEG